jgi:hypothetical protein
MIIGEGLSFSPTFNGGTGNDSVIVNFGNWRMNADAVTTTANLNLTVNTDATVLATASQHLASLTLNNNARFTLQANGTRLLRTRGLTMHTDAVLELANNDLIVQATPGTKEAVWAAVRGLIIDGRNGGAWNGASGIRSATAASNTLRSTGLAAVLNDRGDGTPIHTSFEGESVGADSILVKYTYNGDANLSGAIDADDYAAIDNGFASNLTGYQNGDFDYSGGKPNSDDYFRIDKAFFDQGAPLTGVDAVAPAAGGAEEVAPTTPEAAVSEPVFKPLSIRSTTVATASAKSQKQVVPAAELKKQKKVKHHRRNELLETPLAAALAKWRRD